MLGKWDTPTDWDTELVPENDMRTWDLRNFGHAPSQHTRQYCSVVFRQLIVAHPERVFHQWYRLGKWDVPTDGDTEFGLGK